ncbi:DUF4381 domain-containing protein [Vibrio chaetopteri]|uniref:DUF4381 domain-containing protein n=1 Tax=Vibrio chaetopteri TaxID=3016528 RepID=UPI003AB207DC
MNASTQTHPLPLQPLHLPEAPGMWPLPWGYWAILATIIITALLLIWLTRHYKHKARAKKAAIKLIETHSGSSPSSAIEIVRQAALSYFPREDIAKLSGEQWLAFLDSQLDDPRFKAKALQWQHVLYRKAVSSNDTNSKETDHALVNDCVHWVQHALPPKRKFRNWKQS